MPRTPSINATVGELLTAAHQRLGSIRGAAAEVGVSKSAAERFLSAQTSGGSDGTASDTEATANDADDVSLSTPSALPSQQNQQSARGDDQMTQTPTIDEPPTTDHRPPTTGERATTGEHVASSPQPSKLEQLQAAQHAAVERMTVLGQESNAVRDELATIAGRMSVTTDEAEVTRLIARRQVLQNQLPQLQAEEAELRREVVKAQDKEGDVVLRARHVRAEIRRLSGMLHQKVFDPSIREAEYHLKLRIDAKAEAEQGVVKFQAELRQLIGEEVPGAFVPQELPMNQ